MSKIRCPECNAAVSLKGDLPTRIKCPKCGESFRLPVEDDEEATPRKRTPARSQRHDDDEPRRPAKKTGRKRDDDYDDKPRERKKGSDKKAIPLWLPITAGVAVLATVLIIVLINAFGKNDKKSVASNNRDPETEQPVVPPQTNFPKNIPVKSFPPKSGRPDPLIPPIKNPDPGITPKKDPKLNDPPIILLPPKKEPPKQPEDPIALIRSLDANIEIPPLPPVEQRPVLVLNPSGHAAAVRKLLFTLDSKRIITVSMDKTIRVWDIATGETVKTIYMPNGPGEEGSMFAAALSTDGKKLAVGGFPIGAGKHGVLIHVVALDKGAIEKTFKGHQGSITGLSFNSNAQWLASSSADGTALLYNVATGQVAGELKGHKGYVSQAVYHPKEARVATSSHDGTARIWTTSGKAPYPFKELAGHTAPVNCLAWSPDGSQLVTGSTDGTLRRRWTKDGAAIKTYPKQVQVLEGQNADYQIFSCEFTRDGKEVLHAGIAVKGMAGIITLASGEQRITFHEHTNTLAACAVSPDGNLAATTGGDFNETFLWKTTDGSVVQKIQGTGKSVWNVAWGMEGKTIVWGGVNRGGAFPPSRPLEQAFRLDAFENCPMPERRIQGQTNFAGYTVTRENIHKIVVKKNGQDYFEFQHGREILFAATVMIGDQLVVAGSSNLMLIDLAQKKLVRTFRGHQANILCVAPAPFGGFFMTGCADQTIRIWKPEKEDPVLSLFFAGREWIAWTPEGYYCCSANGERLMGWQVNDGIDKVGKYFPAIQFRQSLYQPEVIRNLFRVNGDLRFAMALYVKEKRRPIEIVNVTQVLPPEVQITSPLAVGGDLLVKQELVEVKATARSTGKHPVTAMRLLVDGRPYGGETGLLKIPNPQLGEVQRDWKIKLPKGPHSLNVIAESPVSRGLSAPVDLEQTFGNDNLPNLFIFAAGINEYPRPMRLNFASTDAQAITKVLKEKTKGVFGKVEIKLMLDKEATKANIMQGLTWLETNMSANDVGLFFFSGHGTKDDDDNFYLVPVDVGRNPKTCVSGEDVKAKLANMPGRLIAMLDCCHSGAAAESFQMGRADNLVRDLLNDDCGVIVICASLGEEYALESPATKAGFFTLSLVEGLSGKADYNRDGFVFINEACYYAIARVAQLSRGAQTPTLGRSPNLKPFALTKP